MEESVLLDQHCCYGCLSTSSDNKYKQFHFKCEALKNILQMDSILLCHICTRIAQHTERFIQTVQSNQILLENFHGELQQIISLQVQSYVVTNTQLVELPAEDDGEEFKVIHGSHNFNVKLELKIEEENLDEISDRDDYSEAIQKDLSLKNEKEDLNLDEISLKELKQELHKNGKKSSIKLVKKETKHKSKRKPKTDEKIKVKLIKWSNKQLMEERRMLENDQKYVESIYKCTDCIKGYIYKDSYDKHMELHSVAAGSFVCDICKQRMETEAKLIHHKKYHTVRYKCAECDLIRISRLSVKEHYMQAHGGGVQHHCQICDKTFFRATSLRRHVSYSHKNKSRVHCELCSKTYATKQILKNHMMMCHPIESPTVDGCKRHACTECGRRFKARSQLVQHSITHSALKDYYCVECDKSFKSIAILKHHLKTAGPHINYAELPLHCEHCDKRFAIKRDLEKHMNRIHLNVKPYRCDKCHRAYISMWSLTEHKRYTHDGFKRPLKYPCPMCDKVFDRNSILKGHIRTHTGERPYQCPHCAAHFTQASALGTHLRLIHLRLTRDGRPKTGQGKSV